MERAPDLNTSRPRYAMAVVMETTITGALDAQGGKRYRTSQAAATETPPRKLVPPPPVLFGGVGGAHQSFFSPNAGRGHGF